MIVVAKKFKLGLNGDKFDRKFKTFERTVKIDDLQLDEENKKTDMSGVLYELDKLATAERNERLAPKPKKGRPVKNIDPIEPAE